MKNFFSWRKKSWFPSFRLIESKENFWPNDSERFSFFFVCGSIRFKCSVMQASCKSSSEIIKASFMRLGEMCEPRKRGQAPKKASLISERARMKVSAEMWRKMMPALTLGLNLNFEIKVLKGDEELRTFWLYWLLVAPDNFFTRIWLLGTLMCGNISGRSRSWRGQRPLLGA